MIKMEILILKKKPIIKNLIKNNKKVNQEIMKK